MSNTHLTNTRGLTLTELLVTSMIVGMIMLGVVTADLAVRQAEQGSSRGALTSMRLSSMMTHITRNAYLAVGNSTNLGIIISAVQGVDLITDPSNNVNYICIRQDISNSPDDFSNDQWVCYTRITNAGVTNLYTCTKPPPAVPSNCTNADTNLGQITSDSFGNSITSAAALIDPLRPKFVIDDTVGSQSMYFEITLRSLYDTSKAEDRLDNPRIQMTSRVSPDGHSF